MQAAALQQLDMDIYWEQWNPPASLIDKEALPGAPAHGIGRPCKVGKEEIVGLLAALRIFAAEDPAARTARWRELMEALAASLEGAPHVEVRIVADAKRSEIPVVHLQLDEVAAGMSAMDLVKRLQDGEPGIAAGPGMTRDGIVTFGPLCLKEGEAEVVGRRVKAALGDGGAG